MTDVLDLSKIGKVEKCVLNVFDTYDKTTLADPQLKIDGVPLQLPNNISYSNRGNSEGEINGIWYDSSKISTMNHNWSYQIRKLCYLTSPEYTCARLNYSNSRL